MNERIKELEDQCWVKVPCDFDMDAGGLSTIRTVFDRKKFAELILSECFQFLENEEDRLWSLSEKEEDPIFQSNFEICAEKCCDIRERLKDHFGVNNEM